mgnify:CR=1 FL=1
MKCKSDFRAGENIRADSRDIVARTYCLQKLMLTETYPDFRDSVSTPEDPGGELTELPPPEE